jgi:hypothetical protein
MTNKGRRNSQIALGVIAVLLLGTLVYKYRDFLHELEKYGNVHVTDDRAEALYRLGYPPVVVAIAPIAEDGSGGGRTTYFTSREPGAPDAMPPNTKIENYSEWIYFDPKIGLGGTSIRVAFDSSSNEVVSVSCVDLEGVEARHPCPSLAGVFDGDTEDQVKEKLGKFSRAWHDGPYKTIRYDDIGVEFVLRREKVYALRDYRARSNYFAMFWRFLVTLNPTAN